jgi:hypothetical protein
VLALLALGLSTGCDSVTSENIQTWKGTERGPAKIQKAVRDPGVAAPLRGEALAALCEIDRLDEVEEDLQALPAEARAATVHEATPRLVKLMQGEDPAGPPGRVVKACKDELYLIRGQASPPDQAAIDDALLRWVLIDVGARSGAGTVGAEKIFAAAGPARVGPLLVPLVARLGAARASACELLGRLGDAASRERAGAELSRSARTEAPLREDTVKCLGQLGGPSASALLGELAQKGDVEGRLRALGALRIHPDPSAARVALALARDRAQSNDVREGAFALCEDLGGDAIVQGLFPLIDDPNKLVALRTVEAVLKVGRAAVVGRVLDRLTPRLFDGPDDVRDLLVKDLVRLGKPALPALKSSLGAKSALARVAAVMAIGELGSRDDAAAVARLAGDSALVGVKGFPGGGTVGAQARAAVEKLKGKG